jgi:hypothetical protein
MSWTKWRGKELTNKMRDITSDALINTANAVKAESNQQVPHDEGTLQQTITVMVNPSDKTDVKIGYGGGGMSGFPIVPYAVKWHENPANFQKGRKHNYLRDPMNQIAPKELKKNLKEAIAKL